MNSYKAPGSDGIQAHFFKYGWEVIQSHLLEFTNYILSNPDAITKVNHTFLSLISKKEAVEKITNFRPISLWNTSYKIFSMLIVNRIKPYLRECISPSQSSFVPGRNIVDNIILVMEIAHSIAKSCTKIKQCLLRLIFKKLMIA